MAQFAAPTPDENLVPGWQVQGNAPLGFAQSGVIPAVTTAGQANAGLPYPPGAENVGAENSGSQSVSVLTNGSYSVGPNTSLANSATLPLPTTTGVQQPYGVNTQAAVTGASMTGLMVAPFTTGTPAYTTVATFTASANAVTVSIPPGGFIKTVGANATAVVYTPTN